MSPVSTKLYGRVWQRMVHFFFKYDTFKTVLSQCCYLVLGHRPELFHTIKTEGIHCSLLIGQQNYHFPLAVRSLSSRGVQPFL